MKIIDTTGRSMLVDLVYKHPQMGWLQAPTMKLKSQGVNYVRLPHGHYALRVCSLNGADVILFEDGQKLAQVSLGPRTQFVEFDSARNALEFRPAGSPRLVAPATDVVVQESDENATADGDTVSESGAQSDVAFTGPQAPAGPGYVYAVVRFAKENSPYGEPPQEEFEIAFQMMDPEEYDNHFAEKFHLVEVAPKLPNPKDPLSREPADPNAHTHVHCMFSGCKH